MKEDAALAFLRGRLWGLSEAAVLARSHWQMEAQADAGQWQVQQIIQAIEVLEASASRTLVSRGPAS